MDDAPSVSTKRMWMVALMVTAVRGCALCGGSRLIKLFRVWLVALECAVVYQASYDMQRVCYFVWARCCAANRLGLRVQPSTSSCAALALNRWCLLSHFFYTLVYHCCTVLVPVSIDREPMLFHSHTPLHSKTRHSTHLRLCPQHIT